MTADPLGMGEYPEDLWPTTIICLCGHSHVGAACKVAACGCRRHRPKPRGK